MENFILPLGTNGFYPSHNRHTMCFFLCVGDQAILFDAGTGLARLNDKKIQKIIRPFNKLSIILSHYHLDHIIGLSYLSSINWIDKIDIYGPAPPFVETTPQKAFSQLISPPISSMNFVDYPFDINIYDIYKPNIIIGSLDITVWPQTHPGGSIGIMLNQDIAFVTDTAIDRSTVHNYSNARVLLHEVWLTDEEGQTNCTTLGRHSSVSEVAEIAKISNTRFLLPIHHHPSRTQEELISISNKIQHLSGTRTIILEEGQVYLLDNFENHTPSHD
jgi:ribonuclease BN (tRNA processing enzyme)